MLTNCPECESKLVVRWFALYCPDSECVSNQPGYEYPEFTDDDEPIFG